MEVYIKATQWIYHTYNIYAACMYQDIKLKNTLLQLTYFAEI